MGFFGRGPQEQPEMDERHSRHCDHPGHHWHGPHLQGSAQHPGNPGVPEKESKKWCPMSRHRPPFDHREFYNHGPGVHGVNDSRPYDHGGEFGRHGRPMPPWFGHHHSHHGSHGERDFRFRGCPFSRRSCSDFKPVFDRRLWE